MSPIPLEKAKNRREWQKAKTTTSKTFPEARKFRVIDPNQSEIQLQISIMFVANKLTTLYASIGKLQLEDKTYSLSSFFY